MKINKLSAREVTAAGVGKHGDGGGLWLRVRANGSRAWVFRYTRNGRVREAGLGPLESVPLADARKLAQEAREMLAKGKDPIVERRAQRRAMTFREAAAAYGRFQRDLLDLPDPPLLTTIEGFHDTPARFAALIDAVRADVVDRVGNTGAEIGFALSREDSIGAFEGARKAGDIPERVVHYDAKLDNVLFDVTTGRARCVVDLDTVMPGLALLDFGDLVRSCVSPTPEAATDLDAIEVREDMFASLAEGYLGVMGEHLTEMEIALLPDAGRHITLELGVRFLTDHLRGDVYFRARTPVRNLERARAQFRLVERLEEKADVLRRIVRSFF
jgi:hypothetical protein